MGFFDKFNPFKKPEEFGFSGEPGPASGPAPGQNYGLGDHNFEPHNFEGGNFDAGGGHPHGEDIFTHSPGSPHPQNDPRMTMPLGESIRQQNYGNPEYGQPQQQENPLKKDMDLISSKLDYLKASIEAINQRLVNLEHLVRTEQQNKRW
jgi:hypothetical protein